MSSKNSIGEYNVIVEDLLKQVDEKSTELDKLIRTTDDVLKKSILNEAKKRIGILRDFLESEMRMIQIYYGAGSVHTGDPHYG